MPFGQHISTCLHCGVSILCGDCIVFICHACEADGHQGIPLIGGWDGSPPCPKCELRSRKAKEGVKSDA